MKTIFVTGASRGLGRSIVEEALEQGFRVIAAVRSMSNLLDHENLTYIELDNACDESLTTLASRMPEECSHIDVLIHNAGLMDKSLDFRLSDNVKFGEKLLKVNVLAPIVLTEVLSSYLELSHYARVVNITSGMSSRGLDTHKSALYSASKAAVIKVISDLGYFLDANGIKGCSVGIDPGWMKTDMGGEGAVIHPNTTAKNMLLTLVQLYEGGVYSAAGIKLEYS
ncbi:MAG: SDR family NAD(P)-dependent oxidoreductase [Pseudomonadales bacterium]|nr:SDR family NAD(P)-dependent oxidoreductase [Pseudomonadales bacterium]